MMMMMAYYIGPGEIANSLLRGWNETESWSIKGKQERQAGSDNRKQGGQQRWRERKAKQEGQARERKKEGRPAYFGAHVEKQGLGEHG